MRAGQPSGPRQRVSMQSRRAAPRALPHSLRRQAATSARHDIVQRSAARTVGTASATRRTATNGAREQRRMTDLSPIAARVGVAGGAGPAGFVAPARRPLLWQRVESCGTSILWAQLLGFTGGSFGLLAEAEGIVALAGA